MKKIFCIIIVLLYSQFLHTQVRTAPNDPHYSSQWAPPERIFIPLYLIINMDL